MRRTGGFIWTVCGLLVLALTGVIIRFSLQQAGASVSLTDNLVSAPAPVPMPPISPEPTVTAKEAADTGEHPLDPALKLAHEVLDKLNAELDDYTAEMVKRERISGSLGPETRMEIKVRTRRVEDGKVVRPLEVYLKFLDPWLARGREVIWSEGRNGAKLVAHEGGLKNLVRVTLAPTDSLAMMGNKYPITEIGLNRLVEKLIEKGERDKKLGPCLVTIDEGHKVGDRNCKLVQVMHPEHDPRFDFHIAQIFIDEERMIPLRYAAFLWPEKPGDPPPLEEEYTYLNVRLNVGLKDSDFDPDNPAYNFP